MGEYSLQIASQRYFAIDYNPINSPCIMGVAEALPNSIEYGAEYCKKGDVLLTFKKGDKGLYIFVEDPGNGFSVPDISQRRETEKTRGNGLAYLVNSKIVTFGTERIDTGFRTILLYGLK